MVYNTCTYVHVHMCFAIVALYQVLVHNDIEISDHDDFPFKLISKIW